MMTKSDRTKDRGAAVAPEVEIMAASCQMLADDRRRLLTERREMALKSSARPHSTADTHHLSQ
jgi:hypothetical protein